MCLIMLVCVQCLRMCWVVCVFISGCVSPCEDVHLYLLLSVRLCWCVLVDIRLFVLVVHHVELCTRWRLLYLFELGCVFAVCVGLCMW